MTTRVCTKCGEEKDISHFSWSIKGIRRHSRCLACRSEERSEYYERNKEKELKYKAERQVSKREEAREYVFKYLKTHPCEHCHETDPIVLTFHMQEEKRRWKFPRW